jgi:hypothetical protein
MLVYRTAPRKGLSETLCALTQWKAQSQTLMIMIIWSCLLTSKPILMSLIVKMRTTQLMEKVKEEELQDSTTLLAPHYNSKT